MLRTSTCMQNTSLDPSLGGCSFNNSKTISHYFMIKITQQKLELILGEDRNLVMVFVPSNWGEIVGIIRMRMF